MGVRLKRQPSQVLVLEGGCPAGPTLQMTESLTDLDDELMVIYSSEMCVWEQESS